MQFNFEETPISIRTGDGALFQAGMFSGRFEIDDIGLIQRIWLDEHEGNGSLTLRRWRIGDPAASFSHRLFDALERTLARVWEDEIETTLADIHGWPSAAARIERDRAWHHTRVL